MAKGTGCAALRVGCAAALALAAAATLPAKSAAQDARNVIGVLERGDSVRLRLRGALPIDGQMLVLRSDTLVLAMAGLPDDWMVAASDLETLHRYIDRTPREGFRHGAAMGMAVGMFVGAATGAILHATDVLGGPDETLQGFAVGTLRLSAIGMGLGGLTGGFIGGANPGMGWIGIELPVRGP